MRKFPKKIAVCILSGVLLCQSAIITIPNNQMIVTEAHSGRTDASGGHHDYKNKSGLGSYHYHCGGNPPHLHDNGVCPYSSNSSETTSTSSSTPSTSSDSSSSRNSNSTLSISGKMLELSSGGEVSLTKDLMKIVQDTLNQKGYDCGKVDGIVGNKTKDAIKKFMDDNKEEDSTDYIIISMIAKSIGL